MTQDEPRPVQEDELNAYVDDRLDPARRAAVERHLAGEPALRRRLVDWRSQRDALRQALAFAREEPVPARLNVASLAETRRAPAWRQAAAVLFAVALGAAGGWFAHGPRNPSEIARLTLEATSAYRTFANDDAPAIEVSSDNTGDLGRWMTRKLGRQIVVPDLSRAGYRLLGGRLLAVMYGPAAMLIYQDAHQNRITVYIQPMKIGIATPMQPVGANAVDGYAWIDRQIGYSVLSDGDRVRLHDIADQVKAGAAF